MLAGKDVVIATKVGNRRIETGGIKDFSEPHIRKSLEDSLHRLRRETIDLYQLHNPPSDVLESDRIFELMYELKREGKIRVVGVSISRPEEGMELLHRGKADCLQVLFNILNQEPARELLSLAEDSHAGVLARVPLASGMLAQEIREPKEYPADDNRRNYLTPKRQREVQPKLQRLQQLARDHGLTLPQLAIAFLLRFACIPIPGARNAIQVEQNASASDVQLSDELFSTLRKEFSSYNFYLRHKIKV
jgi:aryl-alcohol dehydrogenase-like predicted oxidoreductase